jgi:UDP-glucose 4-epimerase
MSWKGKRVTVTGGAGFIGSHLVNRLVQLEANVTVVDDLSRGRIENLEKSRNAIRFIRGDLRDSTIAEEVCRDADIVFHLAAIVGGVKKMQTFQTLSSMIPVVDYNVFEACRKRDVKHLLYTSTACVYPVFLQTKEYTHYLLKEEDALKYGAMPESLYGWCKLLGEITARRYHDEYGIDVSIVRDFNVYGEREDFDLETGHVIPALVRKCVEKHNPVIVWGSGDQERSFVHVSDVVDGMILASEKIKDATPVNLGTQERIKIKELAKLILKLTGHNTEIIFDPTQPQGVFTRCPDLSRARNLLGWQHTISLEDGLKRTIEWYKQTKRLS